MNSDNATILVIEDEWTSRRFLTEALSDIANVRCVASVSEAYSALGETADDIVMVFTDVIMRGQSGLDLVSYLRNDLHRKDIPVLIFTAHGGADMERLAFEVGATEFLNKPISLPQLRARVAALLELTHAMAASVSSPMQSRRVLDLDAITKVARDEVERALVAGYALLVCRTNCERFLPQPVQSNPVGRDALGQLTQAHLSRYRKPFSWVWREKDLGFGIITISHGVDMALRESRHYRAWLSEQALALSEPDSSGRLGLSILVYDFSAIDDEQRTVTDVNDVATELFVRSQRSSRLAAETASVMVMAVQDVVTL